MRQLLALFLLFLPAAALHAQSAPDELVNLRQIIPDIIFDLKYNTTQNFLGEKMYTTDEAFLAHNAAVHLRAVQDTLRKLGLGLKIFDGYRPRAVQYLMWEIYPNDTYVANPVSGSNHNRGCAVDLTLVNQATGQELVMPTTFDWFGPEAGQTWTAGLSPEQIANRALLRTLMETVGGFTRYDAEWWHFTYNPALSYPLLDFQMK
jgi:zinc D-Ala-D-Ala dipeptidase